MPAGGTLRVERRTAAAYQHTVSVDGRQGCRCADICAVDQSSGVCAGYPWRQDGGGVYERDAYRAGRYALPRVVPEGLRPERIADRGGFAARRYGNRCRGIALL